MQKPIYINGINATFNSNIEIIRDAAEIIGTDNMVNAYANLQWSVTEYGRLQIRIVAFHNFKAVLVEFDGDGVCTIYKCDEYGNAICDNYTVFDTHSCIGMDASEKFRQILKNEYGVFY